MNWMTGEDILARPDAARLFPTSGSIEWFLRTHRAALTDAAVVIWGRGRRKTLLDGDRFIKLAGELLLIESAQASG